MPLYFLTYYDPLLLKTGPVSAFETVRNINECMVLLISAEAYFMNRFPF